MTLSKTILRVFTVGALLSCVIPGAWSQTPAPAQPAKKPAAKASPAKTGTTTKPDASAKPKAKTASVPAKKPVSTAAKAPAKGAAPTKSASPAAAEATTVTVVNKRDPFTPLISDKKETGVPEHLPPGKAGLVVATVRVDGTVKSSDGMLAMVSNPEQHVYFIHEGDQLYDGDVEKIALDGVTFRENSKDAFGKPVERLITKRLYPSAGERQ